MTGAPALKTREWFVAAFVVLAPAGCAQSTAGQVGGTHPPSTPGDTGTRPDTGEEMAAVVAGVCSWATLREALSAWRRVPLRANLRGMTISSNPYRGFRFPR